MNIFNLDKVNLYSIYRPRKHIPCFAKLQRVSSSTYILLTTGFDRDMLSVNVAASVGFEILSKPYRLDDLAKRIRAVRDGPTGSHPK